MGESAHHGYEWEHSQFQGTVDSAGGLFTFRVEGADRTVYKRMLGCLLMIMMPESGLDEATLGLRDALDFHVPARPILRGASRGKLGHGVVASKSERPDLVLAEE